MIDEEFEFDYGKSMIEFGRYNEGLKYNNKGEPAGTRVIINILIIS
jgi:hypothetical protein